MRSTLEHAQQSTAVTDGCFGQTVCRTLGNERAQQGLRQLVQSSNAHSAEVSLEGATLDKHGYLVDIVDIETNLEALVGHFRDKTLNETPEFAGLNPSIEHFARIVCEALSERIKAPNLQAMTVRMWEHEQAWAAYRKEF